MNSTSISVRSIFANIQVVVITFIGLIELYRVIIYSRTILSFIDKLNVRSLGFVGFCLSFLDRVWIDSSMATKSGRLKRIAKVFL